MNDQTIGGILTIIIFDTPLIILLWLLIKSALVKSRKIQLLHTNKLLLNNVIFKITLLLVIILILSICIFIPITFALFPEIFATFPMSLKLIILFIMLIIYVHIYGAFYALFRGLGDVVGAGGPASNVIKQLQCYIYEALEIEQNNRNNNIANK